ncbi:MAG: RNA-binding S4 domain-containing protein [Alphaproteobacteria bacterium]|nr:RNA-binding S4 domain-containing protein [Alphaproteobacteria bacterium]
MTEPALRLDKWLWHARFLKTRLLATRLVNGGRVRLNHRVIDKAATLVRAGDVLTFGLGPSVKVVRVLALGARRGPPAEARVLYEDLSPPPPAPDALEPEAAPAARQPGQGRPTKAARRAIDLFTGRD